MITNQRHLRAQAVNPVQELRPCVTTTKRKIGKDKLQLIDRKRVEGVLGFFERAGFMNIAVTGLQKFG
jgi:hypothetical protein